MTNARRRSGGRILVDQLILHGADTVFGVPGESYLAVLDALYDAQALRLVICRQEGGAAMMADAYGKLTGRPGICMVTRGPGATNASAGLHVASQDSTPMILLIGQVARDAMEREAFQEIDYRRMFGQLAKWVAQIDDARRIPEFMSRAFHVATSGRPGPVVLALPEDMLVDEVEVADGKPFRPVETAPGTASMTALRELLAAAQRPILILGGSTWDREGVARMEAYALANKLPVACVFRRQDRFDNLHACYAGDIGLGIDPRLARRIREADLLVTVGARLGETTTGGYELVDVPTPRQRFVHVYPDPEEIGRVYQPDLGIVATSRAFAEALGDLAPFADLPWAAATADAHRDYLANAVPPRAPGALQLGEIVRWLSDTVPPDTIWTNGAGNFATWLHRFHPYRGFGTQVAPTSGSMGYGLPAAVAAKLTRPDRTVICVTGDGDFLMTGQELATAVQQHLGIIVLIVNNGMYGTIRMHQERHYPGRVIGSDLRNPDFVALAQAYGAHGERVERTEEFAAAFHRARAFGGPAVIDLILDPEAITPRQSLSEIKASATGKDRPSS
jgi:acetolactate synthase-1/2/3 large subunit